MYRLVTLPRRETATALAITLAIASMSVCLVYIVGRASSPLPYLSNSVKNFMQSPVVPMVHGTAAVVVFLGVKYCGLRQWASLVMTSCWGAYAAALFVSAMNHKPVGSFVGVAVAFGVFVISTILLAAWDAGDTHEDT